MQKNTPETPGDRLLRLLKESAGKDALQGEKLRMAQGLALVQNLPMLSALDDKTLHALHVLLEQNATAAERKALTLLKTRPASVDGALAEFDEARAEEKATAKRKAAEERVRKARLLIAKAEEDAASGKKAAGDT